MLKVPRNIIIHLVLPLILILTPSRYHLRIPPSDDRHTELDLIPAGIPKISSTSPG
jgi:hypothetical protein